MTDLNKLIFVDANPNAGFNFGYFINLNISNEDPIQLIGECNNIYISESTEETKQKTLRQIENGGMVGRRLQNRIKNSALIVPCFIRPENLYTHSLTSQTLKTSRKNLDRIDKQFVAIINDSKKHLRMLGFKTNEQIIMTGFSASAKFAQRITLLYPEQVSCVIAGGMSAIPCLPLETLNGYDLKFPLGTYDYEQLMNKKFDYKKFMSIPHYLFMGEKDTNDPLIYDICYTNEERNIIENLYHKDMKQRWGKMIEIMHQLGMTNVHTYLIKNAEHNTTGMFEVLDAHMEEILKSGELSSS